MPRCTNCGEHVTPQFARVFGDNEDVVRQCMDCVPNADLDRHADRRRIDDEHPRLWDA